MLTNPVDTPHGIIDHKKVRTSRTRCTLPHDNTQLRVLDMDTANLLRHFPWACDFLHQGSQGDHRVLVHCQAGVSRSATVRAHHCTNAHTPMLNTQRTLKMMMMMMCPSHHTTHVCRWWLRTS